ncbi:MAG: type II secretory protein PulD [Edaphobacter sp.]
MSNRRVEVAALITSLVILCHSAIVAAQERPNLISKVDARGSDPLPGSVSPKLLIPGARDRPSIKHLRQADDAYLEGAKQFAHRRFDAAQKNFGQALTLNPDSQRYLLAFLFAREAQRPRPAQSTAKFHLLGAITRSNSPLEEGRSLDPANSVVSQQLEPHHASTPGATLSMPDSGPTLAGPIEFEPSPDRKSFHLGGDLEDIVRSVYGAFGIAASFDSTVHPGARVRFDLDDVDFYQATSILSKMAGTFAIPLQPTGALIARDTIERRDALMPLVEMTLYLPDQRQDEMLELANLARDVFDLKQVSVNNSMSCVILRGDEEVLDVVADTFKDLVDNRSDVLLDVTLYEIDKSKTQNIGFSAPTSATAIYVAGAAQSLIGSNQTLLNQAIASGSLTLSGTAYQKELEEVEYLVGAGVSGSSTFTSLLGTLGNYDGVPLAGISIGPTTFNLDLSSSNVKTLDALQIRASNGEAVSFRVGSRYPILTSVSSTSSTSSLTAELEAAGVSASVAEKYGGSGSTTNVPQIQFEDLGITLKITPQIMDELQVRLAVDLKIEAIDGTGVDDIPILDHRTLASTVAVRRGETTMLSALVSTNETKALDGIPELDNLPGFESTNRDTTGTKNELLITVTPQVVRDGAMRVTERRLAMPRLGETTISSYASKSNSDGTSTEPLTKIP